MTDIICEKAYAKLNISLDAGRRRPDGYHDMTMVMQTVSLADEITIVPAESGPVRAQTNLRYIPTDERNLTVKAAKNFYAAAGMKEESLVIKNSKVIPVGAGMAGGSADAAAVLRALDRAYPGALTREQLFEAAAATGSDVPFCLAGGTMLAKGRGELLERLPELPDCCICICKPTFSISTPELFRKLDEIKLRRHPDTAGILAALEAGDLGNICRRMYNVFEDVDDRRLKTAAEIKGKLLDAGAMGAIMTGTGSAVFGIFTDSRAAETAAADLRPEYGFAVTAEPVGPLLI